jgi:hypothetical protein
MTTPIEHPLSQPKAIWLSSDDWKGLAKWAR